MSTTALLTLLLQDPHYSIEYGGEMHTPEQGICRGGALIPQPGVSLRFPMDADLACRQGIFYVRRRDGIVIFTTTRGQLHRAVHRVHHHFNGGGFEMHPGKTYIGRVEKSIDWPGVWPGKGSLSVRGHPGYLGSQDTSYVGDVKGIGRIYPPER